ncbi:MAG: hypothetical protein CM15mP58_10240 [Burkholderiaceae bacterium]|nr:MAG: hypothetical protein CM15mP58_10240 [Burkholderiaceae bacterium]
MIRKLATWYTGIMLAKAPATDNGKLSPAEGRSLILSDSPNFISLENF